MVIGLVRIQRDTFVEWLYSGGNIRVKGVKLQCRHVVPSVIASNSTELLGVAIDACCAGITLWGIRVEPGMTEGAIVFINTMTFQQYPLL